jgi:hypothetical protein
MRGTCNDLARAARVLDLVTLSISSRVTDAMQHHCSTPDEQRAIIGKRCVKPRAVPSRSGLRAGIVVQLGRASIRVEAGFDAELLRAVVSALGEST